MQIYLETQKNNFPKDLKKDFIKAVNLEVAKCPDSWVSEQVIGYLCEDVKKSDSQGDYISIPIYDENGIDGGYIHVYHYTVEEAYF